MFAFFGQLPYRIDRQNSNCVMDLGLMEKHVLLTP